MIEYLAGVEAVEKVVCMLDEHANELDHVTRWHPNLMLTGIYPELRHGVDEHIGFPCLGGETTARAEAGGEGRWSRCGRMV